MKSKANDQVLASILKEETKDLLTEWLEALASKRATADGRISETELKAQCQNIASLLAEAADKGRLDSIDGEPWAAVRDFLAEISRTRAIQGFSTSETATFVFSLKEPLFARIASRTNDAATLVKETLSASQLIDKLGIHTMTSFQSAREEIIRRQQEELLELSTPVVKLWDGVLALPMIGTLDSSRTQVVMESLLQRIVDTGSEIAIIDITGVPTVDTLVAQHLLKTVTAIRLMGADCIISGVRPQIAQTIVHLGVDLQGVTTKSNLADALALALKRTGVTVTKGKA